MATEKQLAAALRHATSVHRSLGEDVRRLREDAGLSLRALALEAGIDPAYVRRIEDGLARASTDTFARIAVALGADLSSRIYPNTGPSIRDRHQARILEALIGSLHQRWQAFPEVSVRHPSRGWIDVVLHAEQDGSLVAAEIQSELRRLEQLLRWFPEKVASLPSWEGWSHLGNAGAPSQLLVVRATRATRTIRRQFALQLAAAYPAHPADALAALRGTARWPGPALVWVELGPSKVRFSERR